MGTERAVMPGGLNCELEQADAPRGALAAQVYADDREAEHFARFHARVRDREPNPLVYEAVRRSTHLWARTLLRLEARGAEQVPSTGAVIVAANHLSFPDTFFVGGPVARRVHFMAKSQLFSGPMQEAYMRGGMFPVRRGQGDDEAILTALAVLRRGGALGMFPEGGRSRAGRPAERVKAGLGRIALLSGALVVPAAVHGSEKLRNWRSEWPLKVRVRFGQPIDLGQDDEPTTASAQAASDEVFGEILRLYRQLDRAARTR